MLGIKDHRHDCALQFALAVLLAEHLGEPPNNCRRIMLLWVERGCAQRYREIVDTCPEAIPEASDTEGVQTLFQKVLCHKIVREDTS